MDFEEMQRGLKWMGDRIDSEAEMEAEFEKTGQVKMPPIERWQAFMCDICMGQVGPDGHFSVTVISEMKHMSTRAHCATCAKHWDELAKTKPA